MEAESKVDWQRQASAGTSKITEFLGAASCLDNGKAKIDRQGDSGTLLARERVRGLVNHRPKSCVDLTTAEEYRVS